MEEHKIGKHLKLITVNFEKSMNRKLKEKDISSTQSLVLLWLIDEESGELPLKTIEKNFGTAQSTTLGVINRLQEKGLVSSYITQQRTKQVKITQEGSDLMEFIHQYAEETEEVLFQGFSEEEAKLFIQMVKKAEENIRTENEKTKE